METENVTCLLKRLESETIGEEEKKEIYHQIVSNLKEGDLSIFSVDLASNSKKLWHVIEKDLKHCKPETIHTILTVLGFSLNDTDSISHLSAEECKSAVHTLCQMIQKTEDKVTCTRALWCLHRQSTAADVIRKEIQTILAVVEHAFTKWKTHTTVENEASKVIYWLLEQCPKDTRHYAVQWGKLILPLMVHASVVIREKAFEVAKAELSTLTCHQKDLGGWLSSDFKSKISPDMKKLLSTHTVYVLQVWEIYVQISGKELHHGSFINAMLPIVEHGFKNSETRIQAFHAWQQLINNFATNPDILTDQRRVKLIMQVFKMPNTKTEELALVKLQVWWHFVWLLGAKASAYFEQVCVPLLNFCLGGKKASNTQANTPRVLQNGTSPVTPQLNLPGSGGQSKSQLPVFQSVQIKGSEILVHFFGQSLKDYSLQPYSFSMDSLSHDIITGPAFFIKHAKFLVVTTTEFICSLGENLPEALLSRLWYSLITHMKTGLDSSVKGEMREAFTTFMTQLQLLVLSQALPHKTVVHLFEAVCSLPRKALCSTAYNVSNGERMHGTPALFLTELLLTPSLLKPCSSLERYITLYRNLISAGVGSAGTLEFCQSVIQLLDRNSEFVDNPEMLWRLWSELVNPLHEHIKQTNEVNQGDALEHNFTCMYAVLTFPLSKKLPSKMSQPSVKTMLRTWTDIYLSFARLSALVTNAEANIGCEEFYQSILKVVKKEDLKDISTLDFLFHVALVTVNSVDFSSLGNTGMFNINGLSPAKWKKAKHKPMENIHSFVLMLELLLTVLSEELGQGDEEKSHILFSRGDEKFKSATSSLQGPAITALEVLTAVFNHLTSSNILCNVIGHLAEPISELYQAGAKKLSPKVFNNAYMQKMEKLWTDICTSVQTRYKGQYDSEFLQKLSPLLEATFLHPRRTIKNQTTSLWGATFSKSSHLVYPERIKPVLLKVKEKTPISLPGWIATEIPVIEETPISQLSQAESQAPEPHLPGLPSPHKIRGSFLNKAVSPNIKKSPAKMVEKPANPAKKDLMSSTLKNDDFVVIKSPPKKKRILTEHQKEVFRERRVLPTMYNSLDASQDVSMMSQFGSDTQQETPTPTTDSQNPIWIHSQSQNSSENVNGDVQIPASTSSATQDGEQVKGKQACSLTQESRSAGARRSRRSSSSSTGEENRPATRRSVRFSLEHEEEEERSVVEGKNVEERRIEEEKRDKLFLMEVDKCLNEDIQKTQNTDVTDGNNRVSEESSESTGGKSGSGKSTSTSTVEEVPQNQLGAISYDPLVKLSSSSESSEGMKEGRSEGSKEGQSADSENSQPLLRWTRQLEELSQSSPLRSGSPKRLSSQESTVSPRRSKSPGKQKSPRRKPEPATGKGSLDDWLIKSPQKPLSQGSDSDSMVPSSQGSIASLVEETQSPSKFTRGTAWKENLPPVMETPPRPVDNFCENSDSNSLGAKGSSRKLFTKDDTQSMDIVEDSNIIPSSPARKSNISVRVGTPVIKIKRLTQEEILSYSPSRKDRMEENSSSKGQSSSQEESKSQMHEHDDFSDVKPLEELQASEGFNKDQMEGENNVPCSQGFEPENSTENSASHSSVTDKAPVRENPNSEVLFTQAESEKDSESYDPDLDSTFKSKSDARNAQVFGTENLKSSQSSESSVSESSQSVTEKEIRTPRTYDPNLEQTMASDTPRRGRKRKQETPKQLTPESTRPKRSRKSNPKYGTPTKSGEAGKEEGKDKGHGSTPGKRGRKKKEQDTISQASDDSKKSQSEHVAKSQLPMETNSPDDVIADSSVADNQCQQSDVKEVTESEAVKDNDKKGGLVIRRGDISLSVVEDKNHEKEKERSTSGNKEVGEEEERKESSEQNDLGQDEDGKEKLKFAEVEEGSPLDKGEKTPQSRTQSKPERQSTTKKKKEAALKRAKKGTKGAKMSQNPSSDTSDDEVLFKIADASKKLEGADEAPAEEKVEQNKIEDGEKENTENKKLEKKDEEVDLSNGGDDSKAVSDMSSDDNMPLSKLTEKRKTENKEEDTTLDQTDQNDRESDQVFHQNEQINEELLSSQAKKCPVKKRVKLVAVRTSSLSNRLRSSGKVLRTRGKPLASHLGSDMGKSLSLKKTRSRKSFEGGEENPDEKNNGEEVVTQKSEAVVSENDAESATGNKAVEGNVEDNNNDAEKDVTESTEVNEEDREVQKLSVTFSEDLLGDTPRKTPDVKSARGAFDIMQERNSDSKLVTVPRKFQKRLARRSILKNQSKPDGEKSPPVNKHFHPIKVSHIYSPSASPSASILKRRRLIGNFPVNSPSPPSKQRRVSFAEPLTEQQSEGQVVNGIQGKPDVGGVASQLTRPSSPLISTPVTRKSAGVKFSITPDKSSVTSSLESNTQTQDSLANTSFGSYQSTVESDLNTTDPICPELVKCPHSVETVLPQLTSSMWARGLGQLVRSRNILTIGDLSSLTEREIQNLPIRSPKVSTVRKALKKYVGVKEKKSKLAVEEAAVHKDAPGVVEESTTPPGTPGSARKVETESDEIEILPPMELEMSVCSPIKRDQNEDLNTSINEIEGTAEFLEENSRVGSDVTNKRSLSHEGLLTNQSTPKSLFGQSNLRLQVHQTAPKNATSIASGSLSQKNSEILENDGQASQYTSLPDGQNFMNSPAMTNKSLVDTLQDILSRCSVESLNQVKTEDLFELHRMSTSLTNQVMVALKTRCQSENMQS